jgi:hypothetical protein
MANEEDYPKLGRDIQNWSDLDFRLPILDLDIELFKRRNVSIARLVILSALLKANNQQRVKLLEILKPRYFDPKSLTRYLFEKIVAYLQVNESVPVVELENWIPEYFSEVWDESPPGGRMLFGSHFTLRQILNFDPNEEQTYRAIELRQMVMKDRGY